MESTGCGIEMRLTSVNVGPIRDMPVGGQTVPSAIDKRPTASSVLVSMSGLAGDEQADHRYHGGPDQAVYLYSVQDYSWWSERLNRPLRAGLFGENLTLDGLPDDLFIGDRLLIGQVILEVTGPRLPCSKLSEVMDDDGFGRTFIDAERPGAYCRVLNEGRLSVGDAVSVIAGSDVSVRELFRLSFDASPTVSGLERALAVPLAERLREKFSGRLKRSAGASRPV